MGERESGKWAFVDVVRAAGVREGGKEGKCTKVCNSQIYAATKRGGNGFAMISQKKKTF